MLTTVVLVPLPPVLVPELAGSAAGETAELREAVLQTAGLLGPRWSAIGSHAHDLLLGPRTVGSFGAFGRDVAVSLGPGTGDVAADRAVPLAALVAGWVRGRVSPASEVTVRLLADSTSPAACAERGAALRTVLDDGPDAGLLVLGDGCTTLTERAPGALDERAAGVQEALGAALGAADVAHLAALDPQLCAELGVGGRVPWQVAAAVAGPGWTGRLVHDSAPYGVGCTVAVWQR